VFKKHNLFGSKERKRQKKLTRKKKRVRREYHLIKYHLERIFPFENLEVDTKEILDKRTLPEEVYEYFLLRSDFIPKYQEKKIIRKGHPENNPFVERSHQTDDF